MGHQGPACGMPAGRSMTVAEIRSGELRGVEQTELFVASCPCFEGWTQGNECDVTVSQDGRLGSLPRSLPGVGHWPAEVRLWFLLSDCVLLPESPSMTAR